MSAGVEYRDVDVDYVLATGFASDTQSTGLPADHADAEAERADTAAGHADTAAGRETADERDTGRRRDRPHTP
ncbi:hypothetical protein MMF93_01685 [Streptomyces tubbatahanensis]|uniref:Uncharacterized protein n=1 Tax=Streptomyces tubbatahanensis TaxID=2923272 RepID=A0ABY3XLQ6_9ACTN|nr:hypothetical protein [Streptomyces tubbatahanensis]UNS95320.1 hypothetical protein MMF93_01685 [Streptomyces tubbatahanensis]